MKFPRRGGILLHPTCLPSPAGIGDFGTEAYRFIDFLKQSGNKLWQVLPLNPTGYGDSPFQCFSASAGNPLLISLETLAEQGVLCQADLEHRPVFARNKVDYGAALHFKVPILTKAAQTFLKRADGNERRDFEQFCQANANWLDDFALFMACKNAHDGVRWTEWAADIAAREPRALQDWTVRSAVEIDVIKYWQFEFFQQWQALRSYAHGHGIRIIGDVPIYVAHDSADVWANRHLFHLNDEGAPALVAGVPPDYFSQTGQLWGNPIYRWDVMKESGYLWWIERLRHALSTVDILRLDHFRGFEKYWAVPAGETTAVNGRWEEGPGADFFEQVKRAFDGGDLPIIAEDLGYITHEVIALRDQFELPGMQVLQFAFGADPQADAYKPYNYVKNSVVYTGTHDNDTTIGWFTSEGAGLSTRSHDEVTGERGLALKYLGVDGHEINWDFIRLALSSIANTAIIPLQDVLGLGSEARMNVPARESGNWRWRYTADQLTPEVRRRLAEMTEVYGRNRARLK